MSIPTWSYDESFYAEKTQGTAVYIQTHPVKGKGLFARRPLKKGTPALAEPAMCCTQNRDDYLRNIPICGMCLVSLESPRQIVARVTKNKVLASELPFPQSFFRRTVVRCKYVEQGCPMVFCSHRCQELAWEKFHYAGCRGRMREAQKQAHDQFLTSTWQQGGIDYSDTHFLAMRFLCNALTLHRLHKLPLSASYAHIAQLIKAPITRFNFSFLLRDDEEFTADASESEKQRVLWKRFQQFKETPLDEPYVKAALDNSWSKSEMLAESEALLRVMLELDDEEAAFFLGDRWSELLGAVLLNGQERTPHSPYYEYAEAAATVSIVDPQVKAFTRKVKSLGYDTSKLHCSASGQGIYTIGCLFNHSCEPNLQILYVDANDETLVAVCLRDIEADEELCISYINEALPYSERQQQLYEHYLFNCSCTKCARDAPNALNTLNDAPKDSKVVGSVSDESPETESGPASNATPATSAAPRSGDDLVAGDITTAASPDDAAVPSDKVESLVATVIIDNGEEPGEDSQSR